MNNFADKISIVIACFNDYAFIRKAVDSAKKQTWDNKEIIIVDDGSNDQTKRVLKELEYEIDILITQNNKGVSAARNKGVEAATGEYILILDSDDYFEPVFAKSALEVFQNNEGAKIVTSHANWFGSKLGAKIFKPKGGVLEDALINNVAMGSAMIKKADFKRVRGYDEEMVKGYEDWEFYIRLLKNGGRAYVIPEILFNYRCKPNSRNKKANLRKYELLEYIYIKHADLYKEHFPLFIKEWLASVEKSEAFKQRVMDSLEYKIGYQLLRPLRYFGLFQRKK